MLGNEHFSLFHFTSRYSDTAVLFKYAEDDDWANVAVMLQRFPDLNEKHWPKLSGQILQHIFRCAETRDWSKILNLKAIFPQVIHPNLPALLQLAWQQKHLAAYHAFSNMQNKILQKPFPVLDSRQYLMFAAAENADWATLECLYEEGDETTVRNQHGLTLADYAHFYDKPEIFQMYRFDKIFSQGAVEPSPTPVIGPRWRRSSDHNHHHQRPFLSMHGFNRKKAFSSTGERPEDQVAPPSSPVRKPHSSYRAKRGLCLFGRQ